MELSFQVHIIISRKQIQKSEGQKKGCSVESAQSWTDAAEQMSHGGYFLAALERFSSVTQTLFG